jgi:4-amino-4-deoxychorismate lyase
MSLLFETIKCNDGVLYNLRYHQARMNLARKIAFRSKEQTDLEGSIEIPAEFRNGLFRCRVSYGKAIEKVEFIKHEYRPVSSLRLVENNEIDYHLKYTDRQKLNSLFEKRGICDDILIIKNGYITDSLTANVIFFDEKRWWTPDTPLLPGTQRAKLIVEKKIFVTEITPADLKKYTKAGLINAMQDLVRMPDIPIQNIFTF